MISLGKRWGPAAAIMALIFIASAQSQAALPNYAGWDWPVKKTAHVLIYASLAWAYLRGLAGGRAPSWREAVLAIMLAGLYGASDEFHQSFVPGRGATVVDVGIDTLGAALGVAVSARFTTYRRGV
jgi:VanZ family protein